MSKRGVAEVVLKDLKVGFSAFPPRSLGAPAPAHPHSLGRRTVTPNDSSGQSHPCTKVRLPAPSLSLSLLLALRRALADPSTLTRRDNSLIYLEPPTSLSSLPPIIPASMARSTLPSLALAPGKPFLFTRLQAREVNLLLALYLDRRTEFLRSSVQHPLQGLDAKEARVLHSLGLPASLEAVSRVVGFPHGVRERMGEVRRDGGAGRCRGMLGDVRRVARGARGGLEEVSFLRKEVGEGCGLTVCDMQAMTFLHREKEEDDALRAQYGTERWTRESSEVAGAEWRAKVEGLKGVLEQAGESDLLVRRKFGEWEARLELLGGEEVRSRARRETEGRSELS